MEDVFIIALGAGLGAAGGLLLGRSYVCRTGACRAKPNLIFATLAGAVFGAAVAWYFANR